MPILSRPVEGIGAEEVELLDAAEDEGDGCGAEEDEGDDDGLGPGAQVRSIAKPRLVDESEMRHQEVT